MAVRMTTAEALHFINECAYELQENVLAPDEIFKLWPEIGNNSYHDSGYPVIMIMKRDRLI